MSEQTPENDAPDVETLAQVLHHAFHANWNPSRPLNLYADSPLWREQAGAVIALLAEGTPIPSEGNAGAQRKCAGCGAPLRLTGGDRGLWTCDTDRCPGNLEAGR